MATFTYYAVDVLTGTVLTDLPFTEVTYDDTLSAAGVFSGKLVLTDPDVAALRVQDYVTEGQHAIFVDLDGEIVWAGIVWVTKYTSDGLLEVTAASYWSYFSRKIAVNDISNTYLDLYTLVQEIINPVLGELPYLDAVYNDQPNQNTPPISLTYAYTATERKTVAELIEGLALMEPGFDFRMEFSWISAGTVPHISLVFGRPWLGSNVVDNSAIFDFPGNVVSYSEIRDATALANKLYIRGTSDGSTETELTFEDVSSYSRIPHYSKAESIDEVNGDALAKRGQYRARYLKKFALRFELVVRIDVDPVVNNYKVGDYISLVMTDARHPDGYTQSLRIARKAVNATDGEVTITPWEPNDG